MGGAIDPSLEPPGQRDASGRASWRPLAYPLFAAVWLANTVSNFGGQAQGVGAAWLMTSLTSDPLTVSLVTTAALAPMLLFSLLAGAVADAYDRRLVLLIAQGAMFGLSIALAWAAGAGALTPAGLVLLTFGIGCGFAFNAPAWQAAVWELVSHEDVPAAVSLNVVGFNLSRTAGPALGGLIVGWGGPSASFWFNAASYLGLLAVLAIWLRRPTKASITSAQPIWPAIRAGVGHAATSAPLRRVLIRIGLFGLPLGALLALLPIVVRQLGAGPDGLGIVLACSGGGAVLGALVANRWRARLGLEHLLRLCIAATAAGMTIVAASDHLAIVAMAEVVTGCAATIFYTVANITLQIAAPRPMLGRIMSLQAMVALGALGLGSWLWGGVAVVLGVEIALGCAATVMALMLALPGSPGHG